MKKAGFLQRAAASVLSLVLAVGGIPSSVLAADTSEAKVSFRIVQQITGDTPKEETDFSYVIASQSESAPLPVDCTATLTIDSSGTSEISGFEITFTEPDTYSYTISQQEDSRNVENGYTHDDTVYHVKVDVVRDMQGNLIATYEVYKDGNTGKSDNILFVNQYEEPQPVTELETESETETELETEKPKVTMTFEKIDAETGDGLSGAILRVVDESGAVVDEWTSNGSTHTIKDQLIDGETYRLVEMSAPSGYKFAKDIEFTAAQDANVVMADEAKPKDQKEDGFVTVTKQLICNGNIIGARDQVFYVSLYEDPECTYRVTDVKPLEFQMTSDVTAVFDGLEPGTTYYIGESDENGVDIESGMVDDGTLFYTDFIQGQAVTADVQAQAPNIQFENDFLEVPSEFYREGQVVVTKKLVDADGNAEESYETFYAGVFADPEFTTLSDEVLSNVIPLQMNGASETNGIFRTVLADNVTIDLYVTEVDANGVPVSQNEDFAYEVTVEGSAVSLNEVNAIAQTMITNQELPEETEPESGQTEIETESEAQTEVQSETESEAQTEIQTEIQTDLQTEKQTTSQTEKQTASQTEKQTTTSVKTGDETPVRFYVTLLAAAAVILTASLESKRRRNKRS
jgi:pilin isopeptide linkage protein